MQRSNYYDPKSPREIPVTVNRTLHPLSTQTAIKMYLSLFAAALCLLVPALGQQCTRLEDDDPRLGNRGSELASGLIAASFATTTQANAPSVNVFESQVVCLAVGEVRDRYRSISVVANYSCTGSYSECGEPWSVSQFEFACDTNDMWGVGSSIGTLTTPADASLSSSLRVDCLTCAGNDTGMMFATVPDDNHCVGEFDHCALV